MKTLAVMSQKGGAGKSTLTRSLAVAALFSGKRAAIIDADPQGTILRWSGRREASAPSVFSVDQSPLPEMMERIAGMGADLCIIDTPPHAKPLIALAAKSVDAVLIPVRPSPDDLEAIGATVEIIRSFPTRSGMVINAAPVRAQSVVLARAALVAFGIPVCPGVLTDRIAHQYAAAEGLTAMEYEPNGKAAAEVAIIWQWVEKMLLS
jgi:chromosome partitioning protein